MNILGISGLHQSVPFKKQAWPNLTSREYRIAQGFDSAAALVTSRGIRAAVAEERFSRKKGTGEFPVNAINYCLEAEGLTPQSIDYVAHSFFYEPFEWSFADSTLSKRRFMEVYSRQAQIQCFQEHFPQVDWEEKLVQVPHHLAHAASAFYVSGFAESLILIADGMGEQDSTTSAVGKGTDITLVKQVKAPHSLGILYGVLTLYLGFYMGLDEYKVMGLAPYGDPRRYFDKVAELIHLRSDGTYTIPILFRNLTPEQQETYAGTLAVLEDIFGPPRRPEAEITQRHMDIAAALQAALESSLLHVLRHFKRETGQRNLCMAGGVALNCTANSMIWRSRMFERMFVQPAAGDDGSALGAALYTRRLHEAPAAFARMTVPLWGPASEIRTVGELVRQQTDCESIYFERFDDLAAEVAKRLAEGQILGWFQGRMEFGPRALGNRSILADPRDPTMRDRINRLVKKREGFRPFAPAVTVEAASRFFEMSPGDEPLYAHMLFVTRVCPAYRHVLPAVTHIDGSARVQTVSQQDNWRFWKLLREFENVSGLPILVNTSFNVRGQPIVCTPAESIQTFLAAGLDGMVIEDYLLLRKRPVADLDGGPE